MNTVLNVIKRPARIGYLMVSWLFVVGVGLQVFLAGRAVLVKFGDWSPHVHFGDLLSLPIAALILLSLLGRMPRGIVGLSFLLAVLYSLQHTLIKAHFSPSWQILRALHPVNALVIAWLAVHLARQSWGFLRSERHTPQVALSSASR